MGIGFLAVVIAAAIVLVLEARAWLAVAPTARQIMKPGAAGSVPDHGDKQAAAAVNSGNLPDLSDMKQATDQHAKEVEDGMKETNK